MSSVNTMRKRFSGGQEEKENFLFIRNTLRKNKRKEMDYTDLI